MISINLIDEAGVLSSAEFDRLKNFVIDKCHCTSEEIAWLLFVKVRNDGNAGYLGYWTCSYRQVGADITDVKAVIVLNSYYLLKEYLRLSSASNSLNSTGHYRNAR